MGHFTLFTKNQLFFAFRQCYFTLFLIFLEYYHGNVFFLMSSEFLALSRTFDKFIHNFFLEDEFYIVWSISIFLCVKNAVFNG